MVYKFLINFSILVVIISCRSLNINDSPDKDYDFKIYYNENNFLVIEFKNISDDSIIIQQPLSLAFPLIIDHPDINKTYSVTRGHFSITIEPNEIYRDSICLFTYIPKNITFLNEIYFQHRHEDFYSNRLRNIKVEKCLYKKEKLPLINITTKVGGDSLNTTILILKNESEENIKLNGEGEGKLIFKIYHNANYLGFEEMSLPPHFELKPKEELIYKFYRAKYYDLFKPKESRLDLEIKSPLNSDKFPKIEF